MPGLSTVLEEEITSKENLTRQCQRAEAEVMTITVDDFENGEIESPPGEQLEVEVREGGRCQD